MFDLVSLVCWVWFCGLGVVNNVGSEYLIREKRIPLLIKIKKFCHLYISDLLQVNNQTVRFQSIVCTLLLSNSRLSL